MTIADNLEALANQKLGYQDSVEACKTSLINKDVVVPAGAKLADIAGLIDEIQQGIDTSDATATAADLIYGKTAYVNGAKIIGEGAYWQKATNLTNVFSNFVEDPNLPSYFELYAVNCRVANGAFRSTNILSLDITFSSKLTNLGDFARNAISAGFSMHTLIIKGSIINVTNYSNFVLMRSGLENVILPRNNVSAAISFVSCDLLTTASLLSIANSLNSTTPDVLTMHPTSKTNMNSIMVDNVAGEAVLGSAMTLTQFITNIKTWTIA